MPSLTDRKAKRTLLLAKQESTYGTLPTLSAASDTMLIDGDPNIITPDFREIQRNSVRASMTPQKSVMGRKLWNLSVPTLLMWSGITGANAQPKPFFSDLLLSCGMKVTTSSSGGSSSAVYQPVGADDPFISLGATCYMDGIKTDFTGGFGTFTLSMPAGDLPRLQFNHRGTYSEPVEAAMPSPIVYPTDNGDQVELLALSIGSYDETAGLVCRSFALDMGGVTVERPDVNKEHGFKGLSYTDRRPIITLEVELDAELTDNAAAANFYRHLAEHTTKAISWTFKNAPSSPTSKIVFTASSAQLIGITPATPENLRILTLRYLAYSATDGGDFSLAFSESTS